MSQDTNKYRIEKMMYNRSAPRRYLVLAIIMVILLLACGFGTWKAFSTVPDEDRQVTLVNYQHVGNYEYLAYVTPGYLIEGSTKTPEIPEEKPKYFTSIIDNIEVSYTYDFITEVSMPSVASQVDIVTIITGPSGWKKELLLLHEDGLGNHFKVDFPFWLSQFVEIEEIIDDTEEELGFRDDDARGSRNLKLEIEARIQIVTDIGSESVIDTFVQPLFLEADNFTITFDNNLSLSERKSVGGFSYKHQGNFAYFLDLKGNSLYPGGNITSPSYNPPPTIALPAPDTIFSQITDVIRAGFGYRFLCNVPVTNLNEEVTVTAVLEYPDIWSKSYILVPPTQKSGDFNVGFSIDIGSFSEIANLIRSEIGMGMPSHPLTIKAEVHTQADTEFGSIDEVFTHALTGNVGTTITWEGDLENSRSGQITGNEKVIHHLLGMPIPVTRILFPVLLVITLALAIYWGILYIRRMSMGLSEAEKEELRAFKKYNNIIIDVVEIPDTDIELIIVKLDSITALVKIAENLLKPILHKVEADRDAFCVIDEFTQYRYESLRWQIDNEINKEDTE